MDMDNNTASRKAFRAALVATVAGLLAAALSMAGCAPTPTAAPAPSVPTAGQSLAGLPGGLAGGLSFSKPSDMFSVVDAPRMDAGSLFTGEVITGDRTDPTASVQVYDSPGGAPMAWLAPSQTVPVIAHATGSAPAGVGAPSAGWTRIMLPSRRSLPSQTPADLLPYINQGTGWVWDADVKITRGNTHVFVNKSAGNVTVGTLDNAWHKTFPAVIGANVPAGPTFIAARVSPQAPCGDLAMSFLSAQGTNADGLSGQVVNPTAIAGPSDACVSSGGAAMAEAMPNMVRLSPADAKELETHIAPGTPVDVISTDTTPDGTPKAGR